MNTVKKVSRKRYINKCQRTALLVVNSHTEPLQLTFVDNCGERVNSTGCQVRLLFIRRVVF